MSAAGSWQRVDPGDATALATSQGMRLLGLAADNRVIGDVALSSTTVTPNGDGVNDQVALSFSVRRLSGQQAVEVGIYDLAGRLVRRWVEQRAVATGSYAVTWSGDDEAGRWVHPGAYLVRIRVPVDSQTEVRDAVVHRLLAVAY